MSDKKSMEERRKDIDLHKEHIRSAANDLENQMSRISEQWNDLLKEDRCLEGEEFEAMLAAGFTIGSRWELRDKSAIWRVTAYYSLGCMMRNEFVKSGEQMKPAFMAAARLISSVKCGGLVSMETTDTTDKYVPADKLCPNCKGTGWYGDNGPGRRGNSELAPCECTRRKTDGTDEEQGK